MNTKNTNVHWYPVRRAKWWHVNFARIYQLVKPKPDKA